MHNDSITDEQTGQDFTRGNVDSLERHRSNTQEPNRLLQRLWEWVCRDVVLVIALLIFGCLAIPFGKQSRDVFELVTEQLCINRVSSAERQWEVQNRLRAMRLLQECNEPNR